MFLQETGPKQLIYYKKNRKNQNCADRVNPTIKDNIKDGQIKDNFCDQNKKKILIFMDFAIFSFFLIWWAKNS